MRKSMGTSLAHPDPPYGPSRCRYGRMAACACPTSTAAWPRWAPRSSPRCRRWPWPPARSTSARGSPTPTGPSEIASTPPRRCGRARQPVPARAPAIPELREAVAEHQQRFYGLELDPDTEVLVTAGATEAIAAALLGAGRARRRGRGLRAVLRLLPAMHRDGRRRARAGDAARPRLPPRPATRCARRGHRAHPAAAAQHPAQPDRQGARPAPSSTAVADAGASEHDLLVVTDEVYEHLTFDGAEHVPIATLPGMRERTVTIAQRPARRSPSPAGRSAGWRRRRRWWPRSARAKQFLTYVAAARSSPPSPRRCALPDDVLHRAARATCRPSATCSCDGLRDAGLRGVPARTARTSSPPTSRRWASATGMAFCRALPERAGVVAIPTRSSTTTPEPGRTPGALRVLQAATRCWPRRCSGWGG